MGIASGDWIIIVLIVCVTVVKLVRIFRGEQ